MSTLKDQLAKLTFTGRFPQESAPAHQEAARERHAPRGEQRPPRGEQRPPRPPRPPHEPARTVEELFERARLPLPPAGPKRFYYLVGDLVEHIDMDAQSYEVFSAGELGVALDPQGRACVLNRYALEELRALTSR